MVKLKKFHRISPRRFWIGGIIITPINEIKVWYRFRGYKSIEYDEGFDEDDLFEAYKFIQNEWLQHYIVFKTIKNYKSFRYPNSVFYNTIIFGDEYCKE
jgi:hypothetical protein